MLSIKYVVLLAVLMSVSFAQAAEDLNYAIALHDTQTQQKLDDISARVFGLQRDIFNVSVTTKQMVSQAIAENSQNMSDRLDVSDVRLSNYIERMERDKFTYFCLTSLVFMILLAYVLVPWGITILRNFDNKFNKIIERLDSKEVKKIKKV